MALNHSGLAGATTGATASLGELGTGLSAANDNATRFFDTVERGVASGLGDLVKASIRGEDAIGSLIRAVGRLGDSLIDLALNQMVQGLFGAVMGGGLGVGRGLTGSATYGFSGNGIWGLNGFARGGYTGDGAASRIAGVVHGGEYVFSAAATRRIGVERLEGLHQRARGYAAGGFVEPVANSNEPMAANINISIDARGAERGVGPEIAREVRKVLPDAIAAYNRNPYRRRTG